jgi:hypothetical protein
MPHHVFSDVLLPPRVAEKFIQCGKKQLLQYFNSRPYAAHLLSDLENVVFRRSTPPKLPSLSSLYFLLE